MERELPEFLIKRINEQYSRDDAQTIFNGLKANKKTTFRVNRLQSSIEEVTQVLTENHIAFSNLDFYKDAFILEENSEEKLRELEIYKNGKIYMQSLSSMLPVLVLKPKEKENILDMCAAPRRKNNTNC